jgi:hypothetical protein
MKLLVEVRCEYKYSITLIFIRIKISNYKLYFSSSKLTSKRLIIKMNPRKLYSADGFLLLPLALLFLLQYFNCDWLGIRFS